MVPLYAPSFTIQLLNIYHKIFIANLKLNFANRNEISFQFQCINQPNSIFMDGIWPIMDRDKNKKERIKVK